MVRYLLVAISLVNIGSGAWMMFDPYWVIEWVLNFQGSEPYTGTLEPASLGEFRALSGLVTMLGVVTLRALWSPNYASWLQPLAWCFLGISLARLSSLILDGFSIYTLVGGILEATVAFLLGVHSQRMQQKMDEEDEDEDFEDEEYEDEEESA